ncbi:MAG: hypothetical protein ACK59W_24885 [Pseudanabaena sp.]
MPNSTGFKAGIIFDDFYINMIPSDIWDMPLDAIITEKQG